MGEVAKVADDRAEGEVDVGLVLNITRRKIMTHTMLAMFIRTILPWRFLKSGRMQ